MSISTNLNYWLSLRKIRKKCSQVNKNQLFIGFLKNAFCRAVMIKMLNNELLSSCSVAS